MFYLGCPRLARFFNAEAFGLGCFNDVSLCERGVLG